METNIIPYRFVGIEIVSKTMNAAPPQALTGNFLFNINVEIRVKPENNLVIPFVYVDIKESEKQAASIVIACAFEIENFAQHIRLNEQGLYAVPTSLQHIIMPMSISTARGVIFSEFKGTWLHSAVMPAVPLQQLIAANP